MHDIEQKTKGQAKSPEWFSYREGMFTASLTNKVRFRTSRTERGLKSVAAEIVKGNDNGKNKVLHIKLDYERHFEPIELQRYKTFMKLNNRPIQVEKCGLVTDRENYVSGASPDRKVIDIADPSAFGIIEIKCSEEYKDIDPKDICFIAKDSCLSVTEKCSRTRDTVTMTIYKCNWL